MWHTLKKQQKAKVELFQKRFGESIISEIYWHIPIDEWDESRVEMKLWIRGPLGIPKSNMCVRERESRCNRGEIVKFHNLRVQRVRLFSLSCCVFRVGFLNLTAERLLLNVSNEFFITQFPLLFTRVGESIRWGREKAELNSSAVDWLMLKIPPTNDFHFSPIHAIVQHGERLNSRAILNR